MLGYTWMNKNFFSLLSSIQLITIYLWTVPLTRYINGTIDNNVNAPSKRRIPQQFFSGCQCSCPSYITVDHPYLIRLPIERCRRSRSSLLIFLSMRTQYPHLKHRKIEWYYLILLRYIDYFVYCFMLLCFYKNIS